ncbi:hypothetical protein Q1695_006339 [Nippostrongylus brasiliensis]|nr:hypothetical protein Q1695_006339 [Nippostrongylus brasiliensis]
MPLYLFAGLLFLHGALSAHPKVTTELRTYTCRAGDCRLEFEDNEWVAINDNGCYLEYEAELEETIEFCPLQCNGSTSAVIIEQLPSSSNCVAGSSVDVVKRRNDWFLWRGEDCQKEPITFKVGCTFDRMRKKEEKLPMTKPSKPTIQTDGVPSLVPASPILLETNERTTAAADDDRLPNEVDLLLKAMFPSYRN